ncbi:hypothetical protein APASM_2336 [Actinosynnema pretiosum subsp. pretiosum]|nr:hypothetical protein APASM_2336 [Actinosynnema pretiosum subsp. pretiosum]
MSVRAAGGVVVDVVPSQVSGERSAVERVVSPPLPLPRGALSEGVVAALRGGGLLPAVGDQDPWGDDLQLALHTLYELHYRGFDGVDPDLEWDSRLLELRGGLERRFLGAVRDELGGAPSLDEVLGELLVEPVDGSGISHHLKGGGEWWQMQEHLAHRSVYHLKEADPHAWVIPRLTGRAKAALVAVEFDEFGGGRPERMHSELYGRLLTGAGLSREYLSYQDSAPAPMLAVVNLMSAFGLRRSLRGTLVGHFAAAEITTAPSAKRMAAALERMGAHPDCVEFFTEHVEADAVHEQVVRHDVIGDLLRREPELTQDVVLGVRATELVEGRYGEHVLGAWTRGESSTYRR